MDRDAVFVRMACGCQVVLSGEAAIAPVCQTHDEYRVRSVIAPPPRFRAVDCEASGPLVVKE